MEQLIANLIALGLLTTLQAVLGFDNLLYITLESRRAPAEKQALVRRLGIGVAVVLRILLLFALMKLISYFQDPVFYPRIQGILEAEFNISDECIACFCCVELCLEGALDVPDIEAFRHY